MLIAVRDYQVDWSPVTNQNRIAIWVGNNSNPVFPPINTEAEFLAISMMLQKQGILFDDQTGNLQLPRRPAGT